MWEFLTDTFVTFISVKVTGIVKRFLVVIVLKHGFYHAGNLITSKNKQKKCFRKNLFINK